MENKNLILRDYLQKEISTINAGLSRLISSTNHSYHGANKMTLGYNLILEGFAGGAMDSEIEMIRDHMADRATTRYSIYNYFGIGTLIPYRYYVRGILDRLMRLVDSKKGAFYNLKMSDIENAIHDTKVRLVKGLDRDALLYDSATPIKIMYDHQKNDLSPRTTMRPARFEKKYPDYDDARCEELVDEYIKEHVPEPIYDRYKRHQVERARTENASQAPVTKTESSVQSEPLGLVDMIERSVIEERRKNREQLSKTQNDTDHEDNPTA